MAETTTIEAPVETVQEAPQTVETETLVESAAPESAEPAAAEELQVTAEAPPSQGLTREEVEALVESKAERIRADERESERRRRQTEGARRAASEKRDAELRSETIDVARATLASTLGVSPELISDDAIDKAITRAARKQAESLTSGSLDSVEQAFDYIVAPVHGQQAELEESFEPAARRLAPRIQAFVDAIRPQIEAKAREGYTANSELPKIREAAIAAHNAKGREGQTELVRQDGSPSTTDRSHEATIARIAANKHDATDEQYWRDWKASRSK